MNQKTLQDACRFCGKGLHTGAESEITVLPAAADTGIVFVRKDLGIEIPATSEYLVATRRSTTLGKGKARVGTVEHLLSALTGMGIDNARIITSARELPILDGSAAAYAEEFSRVGTITQDAPRKWIVPERRIEIHNKRTGSRIVITPSDEPSVELTIDYGSKVLGVQTVTFTPQTDYASEVAPCRTFCFLHEILPQLAFGLARGGAPGNAIIVVERHIGPRRLALMSRLLGHRNLSVTPEGYLDNLTLRFPDECARHKMLDLLGDLRLAGGFLKARVQAFKPGHAINTAAAKTLFNQ